MIHFLVAVTHSSTVIMLAGLVINDAPVTFIAINALISRGLLRLHRKALSFGRTQVLTTDTTL